MRAVEGSVSIRLNVDDLDAVSDLIVEQGGTNITRSVEPWNQVNLWGVSRFDSDGWDLASKVSFMRLESGQDSLSRATSALSSSSKTFIRLTLEPQKGSPFLSVQTHVALNQSSELEISVSFQPDSLASPTAIREFYKRLDFHDQYTVTESQGDLRYVPKESELVCSEEFVERYRLFRTNSEDFEVRIDYCEVDGARVPCYLKFFFSEAEVSVAQEAISAAFLSTAVEVKNARVILNSEPSELKLDEGKSWNVSFKGCYVRGFNPIQACKSSVGLRYPIAMKLSKKELLQCDVVSDATNGVWLDFQSNFEADPLVNMLDSMGLSGDIWNAEFQTRWS